MGRRTENRERLNNYCAMFVSISILLMQFEYTEHGSVQLWKISPACYSLTYYTQHTECQIVAEQASAARRHGGLFVGRRKKGEKKKKCKKK